MDHTGHRRADFLRSAADQPEYIIKHTAIELSEVRPILREVTKSAVRIESSIRFASFHDGRVIRRKTRLQNALRGATARPYVMEDQVGFLMRVAMQRHTSIFMSLIVNNLTQTQFAALAKLVEVGTCSRTTSVG